MTHTERWLHCVYTSPKSRFRIICFPHAGGTASFFRSWGPQIQDCQFYSVRYPGRAERIDELQSTSLLQLALDIALAIKSLSCLPIMFFGHSMGAAVALETIRVLEKENVKVKHLFASGSRNGSLPVKGPINVESDDDICERLIKMGGTDADLADDPIFRELILPPVRADGEIFHAYNMKLEPSLKCSVTTIYGHIDADVDVRPWKKIAPAGFTEIVVPGDHFYLINNPPFNIIQEYSNEMIYEEDISL